jgi:predicted Zn-dependent protease with MMP-like domain
MKVDEVRSHIDEAIANLSPGVREAISQVAIFVAESRQDTMTMRQAVHAAAQGDTAIPQDFRAVFLGVPLDGAADEEDPDPELADGVFLFNAELLQGAEDVVYTLLHEIGHALGLDEDEVAALGLE